METNDPDDFVTLLFLSGHPNVDLVGVGLIPGSREQYSFINHYLNIVQQKNIPIGCNCPEKETLGISGWHYKAFVRPMPFTGQMLNALEVYNQVFSNHPDTILLTGGPPKNIGLYLNQEKTQITPIKKWVCQGGFAGNGVVPEEKQLEKFKGRTTCPTFNLNGAPKQVLQALASNLIEERWFVSKNVCHGFEFDYNDRTRYTSGIDASQNTNKYAILQALVDLTSHNSSKKFHDPLAAACAIDASVGEWRDVEIYREKGEWGSRLSETPNAKIIVDYNKDRFFEIFLK